MPVKSTAELSQKASAPLSESSFTSLSQGVDEAFSDEPFAWLGSELQAYAMALVRPGKRLKPLSEREEEDEMQQFRLWSKEWKLALELVLLPDGSPLNPEQQLDLLVRVKSHRQTLDPFEKIKSSFQENVCIGLYKEWSATIVNFNGNRQFVQALIRNLFLRLDGTGATQKAISRARQSQSEEDRSRREQEEQELRAKRQREEDEAIAKTKRDEDEIRYRRAAEETERQENRARREEEARERREEAKERRDEEARRREDDRAMMLQIMMASIRPQQAPASAGLDPATMAQMQHWFNYSNQVSPFLPPSAASFQATPYPSSNGGQGHAATFPTPPPSIATKLPASSVPKR